MYFFSLFAHQATGVREDQLLVTVLPGLPTAAEFFLLPDKLLTEGKPEKSSAHLDQVRAPETISAALSATMFATESFLLPALDSICVGRWISPCYPLSNSTMHKFETLFPFYCFVSHG